MYDICHQQITEGNLIARITGGTSTTTTTAAEALAKVKVIAGM